MSRYSWIVIAIGVVCIAASWRSAAFPVEDKSDMNSDRKELTLRLVETDAGPMIEGSVGDMTFRFRHMEFLHDQPPTTSIYANEDRVVVKRGDRKASSRKMTVPLERGLLSQNPPL